ncbi:unnamed protein product [Leptidea sinapis]|uniref:Nucleolar complex protein 2 homolog n=1 Tax=Leptidea sinapis TaxID=189913 RepID=A0A5E4Q3V5_9NEOP|nr:unnamed protein product [Leptidea sinapis]
MSSSNESGIDSEEELNPEKHKKSLEKLKKIDPDFYNFLEENDENLLNFDVASDDDNLSEKEDDDEDEKIHQPSELKGDSDESDFEVGSSVFNAVIQMCVLYLPPALKKYLGLEQSGKDPQKCKNFGKIKGSLIAYLKDLLKLLSGVTSDNILTVLLKHLHQMSLYIACFSRISKLALKKLLSHWSRGEETVRVLAFLSILRITRNQQTTLLDMVLKAMYLTYVKNCKFVSPTSWPGINFMRRSLVEMFALDLNVSYQHVFLYIRQLAIHLRNAIVVQKIENRQAVYNWQFVNSLHLWADLISATSNKTQLEPLLYPLVMVITNTIRLVPTHQYYPLRFHCVEILINLSKDTNNFIPVLPYLTEKVSMKPLDFSCILRLAKSQLSENGFKDSVIERIKQFLKSCSVANYTKKMRQLLEKIEENSKYIERERSKISFALSDEKMVAAWEARIKVKGTPLISFFENWSKINKIQKRKKVSKNDEMAGELPMIKRPKIIESEEKIQEEKKGPLVLFPSDSEGEETKLELEEEPQKPKAKKLKSKIKKNKKLKKPIIETADDVPDKDDVVQEFSVKDW